MNAMIMIEIDSYAHASEKIDRDLEKRVAHTRLVAAEIDAIFAGAPGIWATTEDHGTCLHVDMGSWTATFAARMEVGRLQIHLVSGEWVEISRPGDLADPIANSHAEQLLGA